MGFRSGAEPAEESAVLPPLQKISRQSFTLHTDAFGSFGGQESPDPAPRPVTPLIVAYLVSSGALGLTQFGLARHRNKDNTWIQEQA